MLFRSSTLLVTPRNNSKGVSNVALTILGTNSSNATARLSWSPPIDSGGITILGYMIEARNQSAAQAFAILSSLTSSTTFDVEGLSAGSTYQFRVTPVTSGTVSTPEGATLTSVIALPPTPPLALYASLP